jgi:hypothetical protein
MHLSEEDHRTLLLVLTYMIPQLEGSPHQLNQQFQDRLQRLRDRLEGCQRAGAAAAGRS